MRKTGYKNPRGEFGEGNVTQDDLGNWKKEMAESGVFSNKEIELIIESNFQVANEKIYGREIVSKALENVTRLRKAIKAKEESLGRELTFEEKMQVVSEEVQDFFKLP